MSEKNITKIKYDIKPIFKNGNSVNLVFAPNNDYCKYLAVALSSLYKNMNRNKNYDILIFIDNIFEKNKRMLLKLKPKNVSIRFFDIKQWIEENFPDFKLVANEFVTIETFYRLFIPIAMADYDKILYLDSDIIINQDISEIFEIETDKKIIATRDSITTMLYDDCWEKDYLINHLKFPNPHDYCNAGVVLFYNKNIKLDEYILKIKNFPQDKYLRFLDQDILNLVFFNDINFVSKKWNYEFGREFCTPNYIKRVDEKYKEEIIDAKNNFKIIHYTTNHKPWKEFNRKEYWLFWKYAIFSPSFITLLRDVLKKVAKLIFSVTIQESDNAKRKILTIFGIKIKIKLGKNNG